MVNKKLRLLKNKKGMDPGQIFVYSISLFIVAFIMIYGYMVISDFIGSSSGVEFLQFQKNIEKSIKSYTTEYGSVGYKKWNAPGDIKILCFTDYYDIHTQITPCNSTENIHPIIRDSYQSNPREKKNIFMIDVGGDVVKSEFMGNISVSSITGNPGFCNYLCINSFRGQFNIKIKGKGVGVEISDATP